MLARLKNHFAHVAVLTSLFVAQNAMAQDLKTTITTKIGSGWIFGLITAGLAMLALVEIVRRWTPIFEGNDVFKHVCVIGSLVGLTVWWKEIVGFVLSASL